MKKSYRGFPIYGFIILGVFIVSHLFTSSMMTQRGVKIEAAQMYEYISQGTVDRVALQDDVVYAHLSSSTLPASALSADAYDFSAVVDGDTFVDTCRQLAAQKNGEMLENITPKEQYDILEMSKISGFANRMRGTGRPTKKERRDLDEFLGDDNFGTDLFFLDDEDED